MNRAWNGRVRPLAGLAATTLTIFTLSLAGLAPASADGGKGHADHSDGTSATAGDTASPQPESNADQNDGGANGDCPDGPYCSTRDGSASENGSGDGEATGKPCAGCVGKADNKNPKGQNPNGSDGNAGYECDTNNGVGQSNPAHTGCASGEASPSASPAACPTGTSTSDSADGDQSGDTAGSEDAKGDEHAEGDDDSQGDEQAKGDDSKGDEHAEGDDNSQGDEQAKGDDSKGDDSKGDEHADGGDDTKAGGDDAECAPCPDDASMSGTDTSGDTGQADDECAAGAGSTTAPASPAAGAATGANRPPVVAGVQAFANPKSADTADLAAAPAVGGILPSAGVLPNTGAGWALMLAGLLGTGLVLIGAVTMLRRRGAQA